MAKHDTQLNLFLRRRR